MQPKEAQPLQPCPNCNADAQYRTWEKIRGVHGPLSVTSSGHKFIGSKVIALVCNKCGYVQLFISSEGFYKGKRL